jgi:hypothetical protein
MVILTLAFPDATPELSLEELECLIAEFEGEFTEQQTTRTSAAV